MKPSLAIDFDGAFLRSRPFLAAHKKWFDVMAVLVSDESIKAVVGSSQYFEKVDEIMIQYLGDVAQTTRTRFARELYAMLTVAEVTREDVAAEFEAYLRSIKQKYTLALITTTPSSAVDPILEKIGCTNLFDVVMKSPVDKQPKKRELFDAFSRFHGKPFFYIGKGDKDIIACKERGISTIAVSWVAQGDFKGDYCVASVKELEEIL